MLPQSLGSHNTGNGIVSTDETKWSTEVWEDEITYDCARCHERRESTFHSLTSPPPILLLLLSYQFSARARVCECVWERERGRTIGFTSFKLVLQVKGTGKEKGSTWFIILQQSTYTCVCVCRVAGPMTDLPITILMSNTWTQIWSFYNIIYFTYLLTYLFIYLVCFAYRDNCNEPTQVFIRVIAANLRYWFDLIWFFDHLSIYLCMLSRHHRVLIPLVYWLVVGHTRVG